MERRVFTSSAATLSGSTSKLDPIGFGSPADSEDWLSTDRRTRNRISTRFLEDVARFFAAGQQVIIVTSGAVAVGSSHFNHLDRSLRVEEKQRAAAIGQVQLMRAYEQGFKRHSFGVGGQIQVQRLSHRPLTSKID
ncbi:hypothetical protein [Mesorhizobium sp. M0491]|uniref:hypothetical protein n=1 Tax=Mesorhizobium sp. M0491 TaxID=2956950 RepID=UPI003338ECD8